MNLLSKLENIRSNYLNYFENFTKSLGESKKSFADSLPNFDSVKIDNSGLKENNHKDRKEFCLYLSHIYKSELTTETLKISEIKDENFWNKHSFFSRLCYLLINERKTTIDSLDRSEIIVESLYDFSNHLSGINIFNKNQEIHKKDMFLFTYTLKSFLIFWKIKNIYFLIIKSILDLIISR